MSAQPWGKPVKHDDGSTLQYWIERKFAWSPIFYNEDHPIIWMRFYWVTWPVDQTGKVLTLYRQIYPDKPTGTPW